MTIAFPRGPVRAALCSAALLSTSLPSRSARAEDPGTETAAQTALTTAEADYVDKSFGRALARLNKALRACGGARCKDATAAALLRDTGAVRFRQGDKVGATKSFARALTLAPDLDLETKLDAPDLREAWEAAGGVKSKIAPAVGSFTHVPASEQLVDTPLPIYVEGGDLTAQRVVAHFQSTAGGPWKELPLERIDLGWGAEVPCSDVTEGTVRYYVEGFDSTSAKVAEAGDEAHPIEVPIRASIGPEAPHLPGRAPSVRCAKAAIASASAKTNVDAPAAVVSPAPEPLPSATPPSAAPRRRMRRFWIGAAAALDFMGLPSGDDECVRNAANSQPASSDHLYCTTLDGADFPPRSIISGTLGDIVPGTGRGGRSDGGVQLGDVRYLAAFDFAWTENFLIGARIGGVANRYPGNDAVRDGRAFGPPLHAELRASFLIGKEPLLDTKLAPLLFVAGGVSEFDARVRGSVSVNQGTPPNQTQLVVPVDIWRTDGPGFVAAGLGLHLTIHGVFAITVAARGNLALGGNGVVPVFGPELTAQVGL